jgi:hypothetical protein
MLDNEHGYSYTPFSQWDRPFKQKRECPIGCLLSGCQTIGREEEINGESKPMASTGQDTRRKEA